MTIFSPATAEECANTIREAASLGCKLAVQGNRSWIQVDGERFLHTRRLDTVTELSARDLVVTVSAGVSWTDLQQKLKESGVWIALDVPGPNRTVGSVVATGTSGPLRLGFGDIRDHVLGMTFVTGHGRIVRSGGRVMKNVAGFDLRRMNTGAFGAFGVLTEVSLRLRALPKVDRTMLVGGERDLLVKAANKLLNKGASPAALEVISPSIAQRPTWVLALRVLGGERRVESELKRCRLEEFGQPDGMNAQATSSLWKNVLESTTQQPTVLRIGSTATAAARVLAALDQHLGGDHLTYNPQYGVRWCGSCEVESVAALRARLFDLDVPVTVERAEWKFLNKIGFFGPLRDGVQNIVSALKTAFDPMSVFAVSDVVG